MDTLNRCKEQLQLKLLLGNILSIVIFLFLF